MVDPLSFRCTSCGNCCRSLRVAVTARDVARLANATSLPLPQLVDWLAPDEVDMCGEPESFVQLREGRRLMVLAQREGACRLLDASERCLVYEARPRDCRAFPFHVELATDGRQRLTLLPLDGCEYAADGDNDAVTLAREDATRWRELRDYQTWVAVWNRQAWHRARLHKGLRCANEFLERSMARLTAEGSDAPLR